MAGITKEYVAGKLDGLKTNNEKREYLAKVLASVKDEDLRKEIESLKTPEIVKGNPVAEYELVYDSFGEALEPVYYWLLDFLKDPTFGMGYEVSKAEDYFAASEASAFYGEMGARRTAMEKRATELLATINAVVKSIINLVYDLREFDLRLAEYEKIKSPDPETRRGGDAALKTIWLTEVDMKKGAAAINALVQNLQFIMLRDAFVALEIPAGRTTAEIEREAGKLVWKLDVPDQIKRILEPRIKEYVRWRDLSEKELRKRHNVEKAYLKSQVGALRLYTRWAKPYLVATNKLLTPDIRPEARAELVTPFNVAHTYVEIFGKKEVSKIGGKKLPIDENYIPYSCIEIALSFRTSPMATERGQYIQRGKATVKFRSYTLSKKDLEDLEKAKEDEVLQFIDVMTVETLKAMEDDLREYTEEKKEKKEEGKPKKEFEWFFAGEIRRARQSYENIKEHTKNISKALGKLTEIPVKSQQSWNLQRLQKEAEEKAKKDCDKIYDVYKKTHGMITW